MKDVSDDLKQMGFVPTGEESPVSDDGEVWTDGSEMVCDATGVVIDGDHNPPDFDDESEIEYRNERRVFRYRNSGNVKLPGGYIGAYNWGDDSTPYDV